MLKDMVTHGLPLLGAATIPAFRYLGESRYAKLEYYNPGRTRSHTANAVLNLLCSAVFAVMLTRGVDREELFERYDVKLWSYNDHIAFFLLATLPSVIALALLFAAYRGAEAVRSAFSL
jgi:hypothetical protein